MTFCVGVGLLLAMLLQFIIPQRYMLAAVPLGLLAVQTRLVRGAVMIGVGLQSYFTGSLARAPWAPRQRTWRSKLLQPPASYQHQQGGEGSTEEAAQLLLADKDIAAKITAAMSHSAVVYRACVLPAYDVVSDTVLDALLVRPVMPGPSGGR